MELQEFADQHQTHYSAQHYPLTLDDYQKQVATTVIFPPDRALEYTVLGLVSEAGWLAGKLKKHLRGDYGVEETLRAMADELGDVLWYVAAVASALEITLEDVAKQNLLKLHSRAVLEVLQGSGDER